ncbi:hypothetical protein HYH02_012157 [Chlamydomonas schloesseri]|uniref:Exonuclease domain-containing protein n=1 Tax=Chlamydomonas schloesseri TaxID=2026947 RepID=A0A835TB75_9CHLO|nr:hypothetical protein HYH02_012157 [Chlamydomonas schloesseri]|eukprot:KAG2434961.1 hypothetical protein HYH02_012157 [Chlamydomonas schloesseri]
MATIETTEPPGPLVDAGTPVQAGPTAAAPASQAPEKQWSGVAPLETSGGQAMLAAQHAVAAAAAAATAVPQQAASADVQDEMVEAAVAEVQEQANAAAVEAKAPDTEAVQVAAPSAEVASQIEAQAAPAPQMLGSQAAGSQDPSSVQARVPAAALARAVSLPWCRLQLPLGCSLVVDTETTGFPRRLPGTPVTGHLSGDVPYTDLEGWSTARVVSIAWRVLAPWSEGLVLREHGYHIVQPDGFVIPDDAARIHGITTQHAQQAGAPLDRVMDELMDAVQRWNCGIIVAHNLKYDRTVILSELHRRNRAQDVAHLERMAGVCTANCSKAYLQRFYRQAELLMQLMGETMPRAHDAVNDAEACSKCYVALLKSFGG